MASSRAASTARFVVDRLICDRPDLAARKLVRSKLDQCKGWHLKDLYAHYGCVNAIEFSSDGKLLVSGLYTQDNHVVDKYKIACREH
jgi:hypothetical protein